MQDNISYDNNPNMGNIRKNSCMMQYSGTWGWLSIG